MCHVSVGHVARVFEEAGIATVGVYVRAFRHVIEEMKLPRAVVTPHPMGRPFGAPGDAVRHREVLRRALGLLDSAAEPQVVEMEGRYAPRG